MYRRILAAVMSTALVVSGLTVTPKKVDAAVHSSGGSGSWGLVWSDEFNQNPGTSPKSDYWQFDTGYGSNGWGNNEVQNYTTSTGNVAIENVDGAVDGKALRITAKRENGQITSGRIKSLDRQYVKYGKIEARIKMSNGMQPGVWPAFWMMGNDINTNGMGWPLCGEIDIMEHRNQEREIISTLHWNVGSSYNHGWYGSELNGQYGWVDTVDNWHTYAVEWYEDCMKFYLDGNHYETITLSADMAEEFHKPHFILLNLAIGSTSTPFTKNTTVTADWQQSSMYVDYVRVYQGSDGNFFRAKSSDTSNIQTTASPTAGMTPCAADGWYGAGSVWDYNMSTSWANASGFYAGGSQNDFTIYISSPSIYEWGSMIRARQGVTSGHTYNYRINYTSNNAGSVLVKDDVSQTGEQTVGIVAGNGTINGSFTASGSEAQILMDLRGFVAGTKLKITGLTLTDVTPAETTKPQEQVTTTKAPDDGGTTTLDWSGIDFAGDGAAGGAYANKYKFYCANSGVSLVNIQKPGFAAEEGLYVTFPAGISDCSLGAGNYDTQGAGIILHLSAFTAKETQFTVKDGLGTYTCYVYYADGTGSGVIEPPTEPETTKKPNTDLTGFTKAPTNEWVYAGKWGCYFGDWAGKASGSYKLVSDTNYILHFDEANTGADWLAQASYETSVVSGHKYRVTATVTTDTAGSIGIKEELSNGGSDQVYTNIPVGTTTITGEYTVTGDKMKVMFELGRGIAAGTTLSFDNIVIEDLTGGGIEPPTEPSIEEPTASSYVRTVHVNTGGAAISKDSKVAADIVVMDKIGGDSYEDDVVYDTISSTGTIKVRGNSTSLADKKPYNISFDSKQNVFGMGNAKKWSLLANAFDKSLIRNRLAMEFSDDLGLAYTSKSTYVDLYVNGVYYGNYLLIESVEAGSDRVDIDTDNGSDILLEREADRYEDGISYFTTSRYGIRFAVGEPEDIDPNSAHFTNTVKKLNDFETALASGNFNTISQYIDVDSFVNFYIVNELFKNIDFNFSSTRFYVKDGKICAGPLWDLDLSSGNASSSYYPNYYENGVSYKGFWCQQFTWFKVLMENATFRQMVADRFYEVQPLITNMISGTTGNSIDALTNTYAKAFAMNYTPKAQGGAGWTVANRDSADDYSYAGQARWATHSEAVEFFRTWLNNRNTYLLGEWEAYRSEDTGIKISEGIEINGFQISTLVEGIRTVYSMDSKVEGQNVSEVGLVYGIQMDGFSMDDMVYGSDNKYVYTSVGTPIGRSDYAVSKDTTYAMTMTFGGNDAFAFNTVYYVRAYAKLADGSIVYTEVEDYTIYDVADQLYTDRSMNTATGHDYLYEKILFPTNNAYKKVDYAWSNILAPANM